jgi:hypothetical protein
MAEDFDASVEATIARAKNTVAESQALCEQAEKGMQEFAAWKEAFGIRPELHENLYAMLSAEDRAFVSEERERFDRELRQDMDAALARAFPARPKMAGMRRGIVRL